MDMGRVFLVLVAAAVIGFTGASLSTAGHEGGHQGGYHIHSDGHAGTWHMHHDKVRHCTGPGSGAEKTAVACSDWQ